MPRARRRSRRWGFLFIVLVLAGIAAWLYRGLFMPLDLPDSGYRLEVHKGSNFNSLMDRLAQDNIIPDARVAKLWLKLQPGNRVLHPGIWLLRPPQTTVDVLQLLLQANKESLSRITIVEGMTYKDVRQLLSEREGIAHMTGSDAEVLASIGAEETHPEGLFAPDTYDISTGDSELTFLTMLYQRQKKY